MNGIQYNGMCGHKYTYQGQNQNKKVKETPLSTLNRMEKMAATHPITHTSTGESQNQTATAPKQQKLQ